MAYTLLAISRALTYRARNGELTLSVVVVWPHTTRIFDQLGIVDACKDRFITVHAKTTTRLDGTPFRTSSIFDFLSDKCVALHDICQDLCTNSEL